MSDNKDYKNTLNLPKTAFPMKADLPKREPEFLRRWQEQALYKLIRKKSEGRQKYILHDGPPYANGDIHIGHALNKTLKDIIIKYKTMRGFNCAYVPGWDCHGLPVEHQLFKELKINKSQIAQIDFRQKAYDYALKYVGIQKEEFKRLGVFGDWDNPYLTLAKEYEQAILESLAILREKEYIYRGLKPVNWCFRCETALAEAEVEYDMHTSPSVFVKFRLDDNQKIFSELANGFLVIWTTTPWTLLANVAVAAHPDFTYCLVETDKGNLIVGRDLLENALAAAAAEKYKIIKEVKGRELEGLVYSHPFGLRKGRVVLASYVSGEEGSGLVHTAPGHGNEDYFTGLKYKLDIIMPVDARGNFDASAGEFKGLNVYDANEQIIEKLKNAGLLLSSGSIQHSYPHCWRCKKPVIFRATKQWFLKIDHQDLRKRLIEAISRDVQWIPASGRERIAAMVESRPDWCLSRQRYWGVPIPALVCENCKEEFLDARVIRNFAAIAAQEGTDSWFKRDIKEFLGKGLTCPHCKTDKFVKGSDILDVWFDSGVSSQAVLKKRPELEFPCALYLEGSDQHRGWFQSSLIPAVCIDARPPFKGVLTHGFVVDGEGRKMSKSLGNVISPQEIIKDYGADILRLWVAASDYNEDIRISKEILARLSESYRKIRNTARFILSNLYDFNPDTDRIEEKGLKKIDLWILWRANTLFSDVQSAYDSFCFYRAYQLIYDFCNSDLSMYYLDMIKGRLYTFAACSGGRRAAQTVIYEILDMLIRLMAPILVFTAEELQMNLHREKAGRRSGLSAHLLDWPQGFKAGLSYDQSFSQIMALIPDAARALEEKRSAGEIGSSFDAKIKLLTNNPERYKFLCGLKEELCEIFKVSQAEIAESTAPGPEIRIEAYKAEGAKCSRCWNYSGSVGGDKTHPLICARCVEAIGGKK